MYECERQFGTERGQEIHQLVESALKAPCPCLSGQGCPIARRTIGQPLAESA